MRRRFPLLRAWPVVGLVAAIAVAAVAYAGDAVFAPVNSSGAYDPSNTLVMYGDLALFGDPTTNPDVCILKSRYAPGEGVGFRMTAIDPQTGDFATTAELTVKLNYGGKSESVPMRYRGTGANPHPGMWTGKWVVPDDAPAGIVHFTVEAHTPDGKSGVWQTFDVEQSSLTIVT
jgi:hypothetical protein